MKIYSINIFKSYNNNHPQNNHPKIVQRQVPSNQSVLSKDVISFGTCNNNIKDDFIKRAAVTSLAQLGVICPCCGKKMIPPSVINAMESQNAFQKSAGEILNIIEPYRKYLKPVEAKAFGILKEMHPKHPKSTLAQLFEQEKKKYEIELIHKQSKIFGRIYNYTTKNLPEEKLAELETILEKSYQNIYNPTKENTFGRKKFIGLMYRFTRNIPQKDAQNIIKMAEQLPSSSNELEAFIVKYSRKSDTEIARRLLRPSAATIEHIKPSFADGPDSIYNYLAECGYDNWEKGSNPMYVQIQKHPEMIHNTQVHINQIINLIKLGKAPKGIDNKYVEGISEAIARESGHIIEPDISKLYEY